MEYSPHTRVPWPQMGYYQAQVRLTACHSMGSDQVCPQKSICRLHNFCWLSSMSSLLFTKHGKRLPKPSQACVCLTTDRGKVEASKKVRISIQLSLRSEIKSLHKSHMTIDWINYRWYVRICNFLFNLKTKQVQKSPSLMCGSLGSQDVVPSSGTRGVYNERWRCGGMMGLRDTAQ